jgi:imidazolonepropionase-like amidohydrolase
MNRLWLSATFLAGSLLNPLPLLADDNISLANNSSQNAEIHCGYILDVESKKALKDQYITVENGVITAISTTPSSRQELIDIDLSDKYCMPGLIDSHVHLFIDATRHTPDQTIPTHSSAYNALHGLKKAQTLLNSGFTTIRIVGDVDYGFASVEIKKAFESEIFIGPRMFVAPHPFSPTGGHGDLNSYAPDMPFEVTGPLVVDGVDEIRKQVRREIKYGADWIKVLVTGGVISQHDDPRVSVYTQEELNAVAEEAHRYNKKIMAHAHGDSGIKMALAAGFDSIEHGTLMEEDTIKLMAKNGTYYIPTIYVVDWILDVGAKNGMPADTLAKAKAMRGSLSRSVQLAYKHGVKLVLGSDPIFPMEESIREFSAMAVDIPDPWVVLQAGTITAAEMLGVKDKIGSIGVGKVADIVATPMNPIVKMSNIENVQFVMKGGKVIRSN